MAQVRKAAVAGLFYPGDPAELAREVDTMLAEAKESNFPCPKALIAPHAGYIYSGPVAATAYKTLQGHNIRRVVLLGPTHRVPIRGLALPDADRFETPLGEVPLDLEVIERLKKLPQVTVDALAHAMEHSLEVHLPFLIRVLDRFTLVPLAVGEATPHEVGRVLEEAWDGPETLIVVSSDLSHYLPYNMAVEADRFTADQVVHLGTREISHEHACGATPVRGLMDEAERHGMEVKLLDLRNSGDTEGDRSRVVGYGAFAFFEPSGKGVL